MHSYLDNNATTQPLPEVVAAVNDAMVRGWGNPSSVHRAGMEARRLVELARESVAQLIGASDREIVFTSGGTEGAGLAIAGTLAMMPERRVIVTMRTEHSAVREACEVLAKRNMAEVIWLGCDDAGKADLASLDQILESRGGEIALVSVMWANNETGAVQPIAEIGARCRARGVRFHTDATQWVGRMSCDVRSMHMDLASFAAHKFHGPKGVGALWIRSGVRVAPQTIGGPQERERRGGTENVPGIAGMGAAADAARTWLSGEKRAEGQGLRDRFERAVLAAIPDAVVNAGGTERLWNTSNIGFPGLEAEAILLLLSERGVSASAGAACSSGSLDPSPVLLAMGIPPRVAHGSVRFSLSRLTTEAEVREAERIVPECVERLRRSS